MNDTPTKQCSKCGNVYPATAGYFYRQQRGKYGLMSRCKSCQNELAKQWHKDNPQASRAIDKRKRDKKPDRVRELAQKRGRRWIENNPDRKREVARNSMRRRRAAKRNAVGKHTVAEIRILVEQSNGLCWWCGKPYGEHYQIDHRIPLSRGGGDGVENLCVTCPDCNRHKNNKLPSEWAGRLL